MQRLFLFHALGADERMFSALGPLPAKLVCPRLPSPRRTDNLPAYARRLKQTLGLTLEDVVGGCSFGGLVASEMARQQHLRALVLISSGTSSRCVGAVERRMSRLYHKLPPAMMRAILASDQAFYQVFGPDIPPLYSLARQMLADTPDALLVRGGRLSLNYFPTQPILCPVYAIHGDRDRTMRPEAGCDRVVTGAGHGMVLTHADAVTAFLCETLERIGGDQMGAAF